MLLLGFQPVCVVRFVETVFFDEPPEDDGQAAGHGDDRFLAAVLLAGADSIEDFPGPGVFSDPAPGGFDQETADFFLPAVAAPALLFPFGARTLQGRQAD